MKRKTCDEKSILAVSGEHARYAFVGSLACVSVAGENDFMNKLLKQIYSIYSVKRSRLLNETPHSVPAVRERLGKLGLASAVSTLS